ncbi:ATP-binding protein [Streptomyces sp. CC224B]|uniref:AAA family ATPase n=1 Tax=Streptomyces sp. CC224B TaxID=3044571 RepID=UPI0024A9F1FF|nr:ATP-binding protein [Streptomyces sp. CC224B]
MLLRFRVANHRSIRDECQLGLVPAIPYAGGAFRTDLWDKDHEVTVLPVLGIFGANASGKSNLLSALRDMRQAVRKSFAEWATDLGVPRRPFKLDPACLDETTLFEVDLALGARRVRYTYGFELSDERVEAEWLHAYPDGKRVIWFDREADRPDAEGGEFLFPGADSPDGPAFRGRRGDLVALTRPDALFLSTAATLNDPQLSALHRWFLDNLWLVTPGEDVAARTAWTQRMLSTPKAKQTYKPGASTAPQSRERLPGPADLDRLTGLLAIADLGLTGIDVDPVTGEIALRHRTPGGSEETLDFRTEESLGTHAWFAFLGPMLTALDRGTTLLVDELDSSLHPTLAAEVVRIFQDPEANPRGAQLVFTTHDATLLGAAVLERPLAAEQVWITVKRSTGQTELYPLTAARPEPDEDLERGYLRGRYGGAPRVTPGEIARELSWWVQEREAKASA